MFLYYFFVDTDNVEEFQFVLLKVIVYHWDFLDKLNISTLGKSLQGKVSTVAHRK